MWKLNSLEVNSYSEMTLHQKKLAAIAGKTADIKMKTVPQVVDAREQIKAKK